MDGQLSGKTVALCVTGSIAAYKAAILARLLVKAGARVLPVMTRAAREFLGPMTLSGITGSPVAESMWDSSQPGELHVDLAAQADIVAIVPATADVLARLAQGRANDLVTALVLCARGPILAAPAMHPRMWAHPATQQNVSELAYQGRLTLVGPVSGQVASGDDGTGRMAEPEAVLAAIVAALAPKDFAGKHVLVTAGPTLEDLDPVRYLGNRSTGKMGFAIAERAAARGAEVTLVAGPVSLPTPPGVKRIDVRGAVAMRGAVWQVTSLDLSKVDAVIMAAAVADYRPSEVSASKLKKQGKSATLDLTRNPDVLAEVGQARAGQRPVLVGFALETDAHEGMVAEAQRKRVQKRVDVIVANEARSAFAGDDNEVTLVTASGEERLPRMSKASVAEAILDRVRPLL